MLWKAPSTSGVISEDREGASETQRKTQQLVCCRQNRERPAQAIWSTTLHVPAWDACPLAQMGATEAWGLEDRPGDGLSWLVRDSAKGLECGVAITRGVCGRSSSHHTSKAPLLSGAQRRAVGRLP